LKFWKRSLFSFFEIGEEIDLLANSIIGV